MKDIDSCNDVVISKQIMNFFDVVNILNFVWEVFPYDLPDMCKFKKTSRKAKKLFTTQWKSYRIAKALLFLRCS